MFNLQLVLNHSFVPFYAPFAGFLRVSITQHRRSLPGWGPAAADAESSGAGTGSCSLPAGLGTAQVPGVHDPINAGPLVVDKRRDLIVICIDCSLLCLPICIMDLSETMMWAWQVLSQ